MASNDETGWRTLVHFSATPLCLSDLYSVRQPPAALPLSKPHGLWVSVEDDPQDGWYAWCQREQWGLETLTYASQVQVSSTSQIVCLGSSRALQDFSCTFGEPRRGFRHLGINWQRVAQSYQGIIIAPYQQWGCRLHRTTAWYSGWDCASGCIWDVRAITQLTPYPRTRLLAHGGAHAE